MAILLLGLIVPFGSAPLAQHFGSPSPSPSPVPSAPPIMPPTIIVPPTDVLRPSDSPTDTMVAPRRAVARSAADLKGVPAYDSARDGEFDAGQVDFIVNMDGYFAACRNCVVAVLTLSDGSSRLLISDEVSSGTSCPTCGNSPGTVAEINSGSGTTVVGLPPSPAPTPPIPTAPPVATPPTPVPPVAGPPPVLPGPPPTSVGPTPTTPGTVAALPPPTVPTPGAAPPGVTGTPPPAVGTPPAAGTPPAVGTTPAAPPTKPPGPSSDDLDMLEILIDPDGLLYDPSVVDFLSPPEKERLKELIAGKQGQLKEEHDFHANLADNFGTAESVAWWVDVGTTLLGVGGAVNTFIKGGVKALIAKAPQAAVGISAKYGGRKLGEGMAAGKK